MRGRAGLGCAAAQRCTGLCRPVDNPTRCRRFLHRAPRQTANASQGVKPNPIAAQSAMKALQQLTGPGPAAISSRCPTTQCVWRVNVSSRRRPRRGRTHRASALMNLVTSASKRNISLASCRHPSPPFDCPFPGGSLRAAHGGIDGESLWRVRRTRAPLRQRLWNSETDAYTSRRNYRLISRVFAVHEKRRETCRIRALG